MILAEKIMSLRKQNGWSQEELAGQLEVSRQSVSKWESAASVPDLDKIMKLSEIFGVSTDYLLKEESEETSVPVEEAKDVSGKRMIDLEAANEYMDLVKKIARHYAAAVAVCVLSPVLMIFLGGMASLGMGGISENAAGGIGLCVLLLMVAGAVTCFIIDGMKLSKYDFLEKEVIILKYGVEAAVNRRKESFENTYRLSIAMGVMLCMIGVIPLILAGVLEAGDFICICCVCVLLILVSAATVLFVSSGIFIPVIQSFCRKQTIVRRKRNFRSSMMV